jgi:septum formation protein
MIVLASMSPRRREIMALAGIHCAVEPSNVDESVPQGTPVSEAVKMTAYKKAAFIAEKHSDGDIVIGADTVVYLDGDTIGKPSGENDAARILRRLSGRTHTVYTGYCLIKGNRTVTGVSETKVTFKELTDKEITDYIATGEPMDKAGAYGVQGGACTFVERVEGDYFSVLGLPVCEIKKQIDVLTK